MNHCPPQCAIAAFPPLPVLRGRDRSSPRAFTLIEVLVTILVMAILAGSVAMSFRHPLQAARIREAQEQLRFSDSAARLAAQRFGRDVQLTFDLANDTIRRREIGKETYRAALPPGCRIDLVRTPLRRSSGGETAVYVSPLGLSATYAVHLVGPGLDQWVLVCGLGGQMTSFNDERSLDPIFASVSH